jgi:O-antigen ligase
MKELFVIKDTQENKISYYHIVAFLVSLPFDRFYSELILISFVLHTLIHINKQKLRPAFTLQTLIISSVFFITLIGILYSQDKTQGLKDLQRQSAILLFPFSLAACGLDLRKYKMNFLLLFSFICVFTVLYLYIDATRIILYYKLPLSNLFTFLFLNHNFSSPINMHATYLSMFVLLSIAVLLYSFLKEPGNGRRLIYFFSILLLLAGLLQLASRAVLVSAIIIAPFFSLLILKGRKRAAFISLIAIVSVVLFFLITNITSFKTRYVAQFKEELVAPSVNSDMPEPRIARWNYVLQLIEKSPVFGYGSGSEKRLLQDIYFRNKLYNSYLNELNAHNQYLSILLKTGILGLFFFLLPIITGFANALKEKDVLFCSFLIITGTVSFSENILDVNKGIFFYAFFFSLFALVGKPFDRLFRFKRKQESKNHSAPLNNPVHAALIRSNHHL